MSGPLGDVARVMTWQVRVGAFMGYRLLQKAWRAERNAARRAEAEDEVLDDCAGGALTTTPGLGGGPSAEGRLVQEAPGGFLR